MKQPERKFSKRATDRAKKIGGLDDFRIAEDHLRRAIKTGRRRTEKFWRDVFGAYVASFPKRGPHEWAEFGNQAAWYSMWASDPPPEGQNRIA